MCWGSKVRGLLLEAMMGETTPNLTPFAIYETELDRRGQMIKMWNFGMKSGRQSMTETVRSRVSLFPTMKPLEN